MKILTWNIGCFFPLIYLKYFGITYRGQKITHQYFQPVLNGKFGSDFIEKESPEIMFIQEIYNPEDLKYIPTLNAYPYKKLVHSWYHQHSILIASKNEFTVTEKDGFDIVFYNNINFIPVHLNSFSALKRLQDCTTLENISTTLPNTIILGDTNIWSRGSKFLFSNDRLAYQKITKSLIDFTKNIISTTYVGIGLDKVFGSNNVVVTHIMSPKVRSHFMDHYPVVFEIEQ